MASTQRPSLILVSGRRLLLENLPAIADAIRARRISPVELTARALGRIARLDGQLQAFERVFADRALADARRAEKEIRVGGYRGLLHGIPVGLKDVYDIRGMPTKSGSELRRDYVAAGSATVVNRLKRAGAIVVGKTRTHELGFGITTPPTRNPWNAEHIPGGSSGGSAAAVAAGLVPVAMGTDTGGSIRGPASLCGVVGLKPTYGLVPRLGITGNSWSLDTPGPIVQTVADAAIVLSAIAGYDRRDPATRRVRKSDYLQATTAGVRGLRIGVPHAYFFDDVQREVRAGVLGAIKALDREGAQIESCSFPLARFYSATFLAIQAVEISTYHRSGLKQSPELIGPRIREVLAAASLIPATYYVTGLRARTRIVSEWREVLSHVDLVLMPTHPVTATRIGQTSVSWGGRVEELWTVYSRFVIPANLTGLPAISVPCGIDRQGLPFGLQLIGRPFEETTLLRAAAAWEVTRTLRRDQLEPPIAAGASWLV